MIIKKFVKEVINKVGIDSIKNEKIVSLRENIPQYNNLENQDYI